LDSKDKNVVCK